MRPLRFVPLAFLLVLAACARTGFEDFARTPSDAGGAVSAPQSVVLFGGIGALPDGTYVEQNDTWVWTPSAGWTEARPAQAPSRRSSAMAASLGGDVVLFGGDVSSGETWIWNGVTWAERQPGWSPPPVTSSVLVPFGQGLLLFGGYDYGTIFHDLWRWDGTSWAAENPGATPPAREAPAGAVLDGALVVFGGEGVDALPHGDTWVYDGSRWTEQHPAHSPSPRRGAVAATYGGGVLLFGGDTLPDPNGTWVGVDETWVWDGSDWTQLHPTPSPEPRSFAGMAAAGGVVVLFGGVAFGGALSDPAGTWTWDGTGWTRQTGPGPGPRNAPAMAAR